MVRLLDPDPTDWSISEENQNNEQEEIMFMLILLFRAVVFPYNYFRVPVPKIGWNSLIITLLPVHTDKCINKIYSIIKCMGYDM